MTTIDPTTRMIPRPVWRRHELRLQGELEHLPTDVELADAIVVLGEGIRTPLRLYVEAETTVVEAHEQRIVHEAELAARLKTFAGLDA
jgi:hypothetical protein